MKKKSKEIECFLYLYPYAKNRTLILHDVIAYGKQKNNLSYENILDEYTTYHFIEMLVENWLNFLYLDEIEIITYRYFKKYNYEQIAIKINYENHSTVLKKNKKILKKIERIENI